MLWEVFHTSGQCVSVCMCEAISQSASSVPESITLTYTVITDPSWHWWQMGKTSSIWLWVHMVQNCWWVKVDRGIQHMCSCVCVCVALISTITPKTHALISRSNSFVALWFETLGCRDLLPVSVKSPTDVGWLALACNWRPVHPKDVWLDWDPTFCAGK